MTTRHRTRSGFMVFFRIILCGGILILSAWGMRTLAGMKKAPSEIKTSERTLKVEAVKIQPVDVPVSITGYGEVKALDIVSISPEVSGKIVSIHPRLEPGEIIPKGDLLFKVDDRNYKAAHNEARAKVEQWKNTILRLKKQYSIDQARVKTLLRNQELGQEEFKRLQRLFEKDRVGTRSSMESAERAFNSATDLFDQLNQTVELYPIRIREAENNLSVERARLSVTKANLQRCEVRSPFNGRIKAVSLETGQYVSPGSNVLTLADDSVLEIQVSLDSLDVRKWLRFNGKWPVGKAAWFSSLDSVDCSIRWTEDRKNHVWQGKLHRVVKFEQQTRTLTVAIRIDAGQAVSGNNGGLPLVEGMFCMVEIPGRTLAGVFRLPRWAVSFENTVYVSIQNRLKTIPVEVARIEGDAAFVKEGLNPGDIVITTRLIDPLENALLKITTTADWENRS